LLEAIELLPEGSDRWFEALSLAFWIASGAGRPEAVSLVGRILARLDHPFPATAQSAQVLLLCSSMFIWLGQAELAASVFARLEQVARGDPIDPMFELTFITERITNTLVFHGSFSGSLQAARVGHALAAEIGTPRAYFCDGMALGRTLFLVGAFADAEVVLQRALEACRGWAPVWVAGWLALALLHLRRFDDAREVLRRYGDVQRLERLWVQLIALEASWMEGRHAEAERLAVELAPDAQSFPSLRGRLLGFRSAAALAQGDAASALVFAEEGLGLVDVCYRGPDVLGPLHLQRARALHALGRLDEARDAIRVARERVLAVRDSIGEIELRDRYVQAFPDTRATIALAAEWLGQ
jgi:hypothetical protein